MKITYNQAIIIQSALSEMLESMEKDYNLSFSTPEDAKEAIDNVDKLLSEVTRFIHSF